MKYKLKEMNFNINDFNFSSKVAINDLILINLRYKESILEFQTPKVYIHSFVKENDREYINLKLIGTEACRIFFNKLTEFEECISKFNTQLKLRSIFNEDSFIVKIPFKFSKPQVDIYKTNRPFNYYFLKTGMEVICLLEVQNLCLVNNEIFYHLNVKEILII